MFNLVHTYLLEKVKIDFLSVSGQIKASFYLASNLCVRVNEYVLNSNACICLTCHSLLLLRYA